MSSALTKSGVLSLIGSSRPLNVDLTCARLDAGLVENDLERHALPARVAHRAVAQLSAGDARSDKSAAVARALVHSHELHGVKLLELLQRELHGFVDLALDLDGERVGIDIERYAGEVIAHEEGVIRRDGAFVEYRERRLELGRPAGEPDHRALLRIFDQRPLAVFERHRHGVERQRSEGAECRS